MTNKPNAGEAARLLLRAIDDGIIVECADQIKLVSDSYLSSAARIEELEKALPRLKQSLDAALNDHLCDMKDGCDDSISGFNDAWDIMRKKFGEYLARAASKDTP